MPRLNFALYLSHLQMLADEIGPRLLHKNVSQINRNIASYIEKIHNYFLAFPVFIFSSQLLDKYQSKHQKNRLEIH